MKLKNLIPCATIFLLVSCQTGYEQEYKTFTDFDKRSERNKTWFPKIVFKDATNLKNISYLESKSAFGKFTFENQNFYDSIFANKTNININLFREKAHQNENSIPAWFININQAGIENNMLITDDNFYILKDRKSKTIYFILSQ